MSARPGVEGLPASSFKDGAIRFGKIVLSAVLMVVVVLLAALFMSWVVGWSLWFCLQIVVAAWITTIAIRVILFIGNNGIFE